MAITGIGVDLVDIARFEQQLGKTPGLTERLFSPAELSGDSALKPATLAGKFAAKEAFIKALGSGVGLNWHDVRVVKDSDGKPFFELSGDTAAASVKAGVSRWHLSIAHDGGMAIAYAIAENDATGQQGGAHA
ncbi:MAG: hypothetical protein RLZZ304_938 [Actinomycetota bacterium]|jgi:holo-[acyl-carrier protein] synthase